MCCKVLPHLYVPGLEVEVADAQSRQLGCAKTGARREAHKQSIELLLVQLRGERLDLPGFEEHRAEAACVVTLRESDPR